LKNDTILNENNKSYETSSYFVNNLPNSCHLSSCGAYRDCGLVLLTKQDNVWVTGSQMFVNTDPNKNYSMAVCVKCRDNQGAQIVSNIIQVDVTFEIKEEPELEPVAPRRVVFTASPSYKMSQSFKVMSEYDKPYFEIPIITSSSNGFISYIL
jgi:hypothetical protein